MGDNFKWQLFEEKWPKLLEKHGVPYFHMKELERPDGVYKKWHPLKEHQEDIASFYKDMTSLISECWVSGFLVDRQN